jgi:hypothetical protein
MFIEQSSMLFLSSRRESGCGRRAKRLATDYRPVWEVPRAREKQNVFYILNERNAQPASHSV